MTFIERWLVYPAPPVASADWAPVGVHFEGVRFESGDGTPLFGWFFPNPAARRGVLFCHGNGELVGHNAEYCTFLRDWLRAEVFAFDYRGYGHSGGTPTEAGVLADGLAAARWLAGRRGESVGDLVLLGRSLGGAVAVAVAAEQGARAVVLQSTFASLVDVAAGLFWWLPVRFFMQNRFDSLARIARYEGPLAVCHGTADTLVPLAQGKRLYDAAPTRRKFFHAVEGAGHNDPPDGAFWTRLRGFLEAPPEGEG